MRIWYHLSGGIRDGGLGFRAVSEGRLLPGKIPGRSRVEMSLALEAFYSSAKGVRNLSR
jgi:hypothetical protein